MRAIYFCLTVLELLAVGTGRLLGNGNGNLYNILGQNNGKQRDPNADNSACSPINFYAAPGQGGGYDKCKFMRCIGGKQSEESCAFSRGVDDELLTRGFGLVNRRPNPCSKIRAECSPSYAGKGVVDVVVNTCGVDLLFIVDVSCSLEDRDKAKVKQFVMDAIRTLDLGRVDTQVAVIHYHSQVFADITFNDPASWNSVRAYREVQEKLPTTNPPSNLCGTNTNGALRFAREQIFNKGLAENKQADAGEMDVRFAGGDRQGRKDIVMLMTDGSTYPPEFKDDTLLQAKLLKDQGTTIHLITLPNNNPNAKTDKAMQARMAEEFAKIPSSPEFRYDMASFDELQQLLKDFKELSCMTL